MSESMNLNLLPTQAKFQMARMHARKLVRKILVGTATAWVAVAVLIMGIWLIDSWRYSAADKKYKAAEADYAGLGDSAVTSLQLKYRAKLVGALLKSRFEYGKALERIKNFFPPGVKLKDYELTKGSFFQITGTCDSIGCMESVEKKVDEINKGGSEDFSGVKLSSLKWSETVWEFTMEVGIK